MRKQLILQYLEDTQQSQLSLGIETLSEEKLVDFWEELQKYGKAFHEQKQVYNKGPLAQLCLHECEAFEKKGSLENQLRGKKILEEGKAGCMILAGGQGSRLGVKIPKGVMGVSPIKGKSLFQIFCEKTLALSKKVNRPLPLVIMTSSLNHEETLAFFEQNQWFGLDKEQVDIFCQEDMPFLDHRGRWLLQEPGKLAKGPDGNGNALTLFYQMGLWDKWRRQGIEILNMIPVDNAMADPFDAELFGFHDIRKADITITATSRLDEKEKVGVLANIEGKIRIVEYSDLSEKDSIARNEKGDLRFGLANIGLFCFSMGFIEALAKKNPPLPWHLADKETEALELVDGVLTKQKKRIWKFERFIFDVFACAGNIQVLVSDRASCYAPLKNASGDKSVETVREALLTSYKKIYSEITGIMAPTRNFELDPAFYYPTAQLLESWKGKVLPETDYIKAELL